MFANSSLNVQRLALLPVLLFIAAFTFLVTSPTPARAATTLDAITVGCSSVTFTFTTTDAGAYELHSHVYSAGYSEDLVGSTSNHYVALSGAGTYTFTFDYSTPQPAGSEILFDEIHIHGDDGDTVVNGTYICGDAAQGSGFVDGRINGLFGDDEAVIYVESDDAGNPALHIYCINSSGLGYLGLVVTEADLAGIPATPAQNTLVKQSDECDVSFYVLTDGSYQINIGDDEEGKSYVVTGTGFTLSNREYYVVELPR